MRIHENSLRRAWREPDEIDFVALREARRAPALPAPAPQPQAETPFWDAAAAAPTALQQLAPPPVQAPPPAPPPPPQPAPYVGERPVEAAWLQQRQAALGTLRAEYEAAMAVARSRPGQAPGWVVADPDRTAHGGANRVLQGELVYIVDRTVRTLRGDTFTQGHHERFDAQVFEAAWQAQLQAGTAAPAAQAALQALAELYDSTPERVFADRPGLWPIAIREHALNAGPAPAGRAMGDPGQLGMLDLYLADPQIAELIATFGGTAAPATGGLAPEQVRIYGEQRYAQLTKLGQAMQAVRDDYNGALAHAHARGGPGWVSTTYEITYADEGTVWRSGEYATRSEFSVDAFTDWYIAQDGVAHRAFASFYGRSRTEYGGDESGAQFVSRISFDNPNWQMAGVGAGMSHLELVRFDPNHPPELNDSNAIGFDLEAGWATHHGNIHEDRNWFETLVQVAMVAAVSYVTAGTLGAAASAAVGGGVAGAAASAAVVGAAASVVSGAMSGNLSLKGVLTGALSGALSAGLIGGLNQAVGGLGTVGTIAARTTIQGGIQALLGGSFKDGALAGFASGLADLAGDSLKANIDAAVLAGTMSAAEAAGAHTFARVLGSAIRAAGNPGDPTAAFANAFLSDVMAETDPAGFRRPAAIQLAFDDEGFVMPGIVDVSAPWEQQQAQLRARLVQQGLDMASADAAVAGWSGRMEQEAFDAFVTAQPAPLVVAGLDWTPDVRDARQVIDQIESRIADGSLRGAAIGNAIQESYDTYLRLAAGVSASGAAPTHDQELAASRLITLIGDLGHLAQEQGVTLSEADQRLVRQSRAVQVQRYLPDVYGAAAGGGILALRQNHRLAALDAWAAKPHLRHPDTLIGRSDGGPGEWVYVQQRTAGADLQEQVSGVPRGIEYRINGVHFDGFDAPRRVAVDAKDWQGYPPVGTNFWQSKAVGDAIRQLNALRGTGVRLEWQVSSEAAANQVRTAFASPSLSPEIVNQLSKVSVVVVKPIPGP